MQIKKKTLAVLMLATTMGLAACDDSSTDNSAADNSQADANKTYVVALDNSYPPFSFQENGKEVGIDAEIIEAIAKDQNIPIDVQQMDFSGIIPAMQAGKVDIGMGGMSITDERKNTVDFSDPYYKGGVAVVIDKNNTEIKKAEDLKGKTIAVKNGTAGAVEGDKLADKYGYQLTRVEDSPSMVQEVTNGSSAAFLEDYPVVQYAIKVGKQPLQVVGEPLTNTEYGISVIKGKNQEVLKKINEGLKHIKDNGEYDKIIHKYTGE